MNTIMYIFITVSVLLLLITFSSAIAFLRMPNDNLTRLIIVTQNEKKLKGLATIFSFLLVLWAILAISLSTIPLI